MPSAGLLTEEDGQDGAARPDDDLADEDGANASLVAVGANYSHAEGLLAEGGAEARW